MTHKDKEKRLDYYRKWQKKFFIIKRKELMEILGGMKCCQCGNNDFRVLQLDHIIGDGYLDKVRFYGISGKLRYYIKNPEKAKKELQVLCANCHTIKTFENKEYHHVKRRKLLCTP